MGPKSLGFFEQDRKIMTPTLYPFTNPVLPQATSFFNSFQKSLHSSFALSGIRIKFFLLKPFFSI